MGVPHLVVQAGRESAREGGIYCLFYRKSYRAGPARVNQHWQIAGFDVNGCVDSSDYPEDCEAGVHHSGDLIPGDSPKDEIPAKGSFLRQSVSAKPGARRMSVCTEYDRISSAQLVRAVQLSTKTPVIQGQC